MPKHKVITIKVAYHELWVPSNEELKEAMTIEIGKKALLDDYGGDLESFSVDVEDDASA